MVFSYNWLQSFFQSKLAKPEKLAELLVVHSFEIDSLKKKNNDYLLDIDVLPNRSSDCFSHLGIAREIAAITDKKLKYPQTISKKTGSKAEDRLGLEIKSEKDCSRYTARIVEGVKVGPSPKWLKEKIGSCGIQSINNIVDITNYVMLEMGQPLHAFDFDKIQKKLIVRRAGKKEKITTLDDKSYNLDKDILVIADPRGPLAIAGIKGGKRAGITEKTSTIVLESANFSPLLIRRASKKLQLRTDASWRFENEIDSNLTEEAINRAAFLVKKVANGKALRSKADFYPKKRFPKKIKIDPSIIRSLLGVIISEKDIRGIFSRLGLENKKKQHLIEVEIPTRRLDLLTPQDLVEEVGRIYGYDNILPSFPLSSLIPPQKNPSVFWENFTKDIFKELGFFESYNYSFIKEQTKKIFGYRNLVELENPLSEEQKYLRPSLMPNLLENIKNSEKKDVSFFEIGKVFWPDRKEKEKAMISALSFQKNFYFMKGVVDTLFKKMGISSFRYNDFNPFPRETNNSVWEKGRRAEIKIGSKKIGFLGEISQDILNKKKIKGKVSSFEIDFEELQKIASEEQEYRPISRFPAAMRDIAVLVPREVKTEAVMNKINAVGGSLIRNIDLFDIYEGGNLPAGKKSLAFHIIYQAKDRTLSSEAINKLQERTIAALEHDPEWQVRKY